MGFKELYCYIMNNSMNKLNLSSPFCLLTLETLKSFASCYCSDLRPPYTIQLQGANITHVPIITEIHQAFFIFCPVNGNLKVAIINLLAGV